MKTKFFVAAVAVSMLMLGSCKKSDAPHEHNYAWKVKDAVTCTHDGKEVGTCECGDTQERVIKAKGHQFHDGRCEACGVYQIGSMTVIGTSVTVRKAPTTSSERLSGVTKGDSITILEVEENGEFVTNTTTGITTSKWTKTVLETKAGKIYGWVSNAFLAEPAG